MKIVRKAAAMLRSKTCVLGARFLVLASLRRRMAAVVAASHSIHALVTAADGREKVAGDCHKALVLRRKVVVDIDHYLAEYEQQEYYDDDGGAGCPDWTRSLFNDDDDNLCYTDEYDQDDGDDRRDLLDDDACCDDDACGDDEEPSVMDVIRSSREDEGLEFNMDDEIDQAAGMFIQRFRERMNRSFWKHLRKIDSTPSVSKCKKS